MNMVTVNILSMSVKDCFFEKYSVFKMRVGKNDWKKLDMVNNEFLASAMEYDGPDRNFFVLVPAEPAAQIKVRNKLDELGFDYGTVQKMGKSSIPYKLILSAAVRARGGMVLSGRLYLYSPGITDGVFLGRRFSFTMPEISVDANGVISVHNVTFRKVEGSGYDETKGSPVYTVNKGDLVRKYDPPFNDCVYRHGVEGQKAETISWLSVGKVASFHASRNHMIRDIVCRANKLFDGCVTLSFREAESIQDYSTGMSAKKYKASTDVMIKKRFFDIGIDSDIPEMLEEYGIAKGNDAAIRLIDSKEEYKARGVSDEHVADLSVQQVLRDTVDNLKLEDGTYKPRKNRKGEIVGKYSGGVMGVFRKNLIELAIKQDILACKDILNPDAEPMIVLMRSGEDRMIYASRDAQGCLEFGSFYISGIDSPDCVLPYIDEISCIDEDKFIIHEGMVYGLKETMVMPLADQMASTEIRERDGKVRGDKKDGIRTRLFGGMLDAHIYAIDDHIYYYASVPGSGMNETIDKAFYLVEIIGGSVTEDYTWLLDSVCVTYVGVGDRYTKFPYLFKYLREWDAAQPEL